MTSLRNIKNGLKDRAYRVRVRGVVWRRLVYVVARRKSTACALGS